MPDFDISSYEAVNAARRLNDFGIDLSPNAQRHLDRLTELRENQPPAPLHNAVAELLADNAKPADLDRAIAEHVGYSHRFQQHQVAQNLVGARVLDAIAADADRIHAELKAQALEHIARLHRAADIDESVADLTRARRVEDAHLAATVESDVEELRALYYVRDEYLYPGSSQRWSTGWWNASQVSNPWDVKHPAPKDDTRWGQWKATIKANGRFWFPTLTEAREASQAHEPKTTLPVIDPERPRRAVFLT